MTGDRHDGELIGELRRLAAALESVGRGPGGDDLPAEASRLAAMIGGYLIPRLQGPDRPLLVVFAGPTGSGKSTLLNTLAGSDVSRAGALRPTTTRPVVLAAPRHASRFATIAGVHCRVVMGNATFLGTMTMVDTPDIDSTEEGHRVVAETMVDQADIVVFVTSALRYADEVPWQVLRRAVSRGAPVVIVLNRVVSEGSGAVGDFRAMLAAEGFDDDLVVVPEHNLTPGAQRLPALAARSLWARINELVAAGEESAAHAGDRVLRSILDQVDQIISQLDTLAEAGAGLHSGLATLLSERVAHLDLAAVGQGLTTPPPAGGRRSAWVRRNRRSFEEVADLEKTVVARVVELAKADLRAWLMEDDEYRQADPPAVGRLDQLVAAAVASTTEGWISFVRRIADERRTPNPWLSEAVLVDSALSGEPSSGAVALFGEDAATLVDRAARDLAGRLEDAYVAVAGSVAAMAQRQPRAARQAAELRTAHRAVASRIAPVHA